MSASWLDPRRPWTVRVGDCRAAMADMDPDSVDATVTDTPYGLSTVLDPPRMTQETAWRRIMEGRAERARPLQEYIVEAIDDFCDRKARMPDCDETVALLTAAMETRRNLGSPFDRLLGEWLDTGENPRLKGRGFMGNEWDALVPPPNTWRAVWRVQKPGAYLFAFAGARTHGLIDTAIRLADFEVDDEFCVWLQGQGMVKRVRLDRLVNEHHEPANAKAERKAAMKRTGRSIAAPRHPAGDPFIGWDRSRAPRFEPIIVAAKPLAGTIAENALRYGTGGLNVDACRIERGDAGRVVATRGRSDGRATYDIGGDGEPISIDPRGGFPSNVILDEAAAEALDASVPPSRDGVAVKRNTAGKVTGRIFKVKSTGEDATFGGGGGPSRFFYVAKAATSERDKGLEAMPVLTPGERSGREDGSAGINGYAGTRGEARNIHPTVKAVALMRYLVRMACPPGAWDPEPEARPLVFDPFMGTASTGVACMVEGVRFVGAEMSEEYAAIAKARLQHAYALPREAVEAGDGEDGGADRPRSAAAQGSLW